MLLAVRGVYSVNLHDDYLVLGATLRYVPSVGDGRHNIIRVVLFMVFGECFLNLLRTFSRNSAGTSLLMIQHGKMSTSRRLDFLVAPPCWPAQDFMGWIVTIEMFPVKRNLTVGLWTSKLVHSLPAEVWARAPEFKSPWQSQLRYGNSTSSSFLYSSYHLDKVGFQATNWIPVW